MGTFWSIGPLRGLFQPDSFDEKQETAVGRFAVVGGVEMVQFKHWNAREITLKFLVSAVDAPDSTNESVRSSNVDDCDPEKVWAKIIELQRPSQRGLPTEIPVVIPGWGSGSHSASEIQGRNENEDVVFRGKNTDANGNQTNTKGNWSSGSGSWPTMAIIKSSSIERTHIRGDGAALRAVISVTLVESTEINLDPSA